MMEQVNEILMDVYLAEMYTTDIEKKVTAGNSVKGAFW